MYLYTYLFLFLYFVYTIAKEEKQRKTCPAEWHAEIPPHRQAGSTVFFLQRRFLWEDLVFRAEFVFHLFQLFCRTDTIGERWKTNHVYILPAFSSLLRPFLFSISQTNPAWGGFSAFSFQDGLRLEVRGGQMLPAQVHRRPVRAFCGAGVTGATSEGHPVPPVPEKQQNVFLYFACPYLE